MGPSWQLGGGAAAPADPPVAPALDRQTETTNWLSQSEANREMTETLREIKKRKKREMETVERIETKREGEVESKD